jgi:hypothetical protein
MSGHHPMQMSLSESAPDWQTHVVLRASQSRLLAWGKLVCGG